SDKAALLVNSACRADVCLARLPKSPELPKLIIENLRKTRRRRAPALPRKSRNLSHPMVAFFIAQNSFWRKTVTREEIIAAVKECTARLGRAPGADEFRLTMSVRRHLIRKYFSKYTDLLK